LKKSNFSKNRLIGWWLVNWWRKIVLIILAFLMVSIGSMYAVARWYIHKHAHEPFRLGATFIPDYAEQLGVDPKETMDAIIGDLGVKNLRLVSYWEDTEPTPGKYDFSTLDWQFAKAEAAHVHVSLAIGLRQPRWPECHEPDWAFGLPKDQWHSDLANFIRAVVDRYKTSPALDSYQLENEFFLKVFGECTDFDRDRLVSEFNLVKSLDPNHKLVVSMSNNAIGTPLGEPTPDEWAISVYKRVWDKGVTKRYFEYPIPAWYYAFRAGFTEITRGHDSFIHELQAEAWLPDPYNIADAPLNEMAKTMTPERLRDRFAYGEATGMREVDLWGVEWWYQMKVKRDQPGLWDVAKQEYAKANHK